MIFVVAYDIPDDKRRTRMRKTLLGFGTPVQYSVFECDLSPRELGRLKKAVLAVMRPAEDNVRYYQLCGSCARRVDVCGGEPLAERKEAYIV